MNPELTHSLTQPSHLRSTIPVEIRDNSCNSCLDFISSDESLDRYNEIISASGWKLDNYLRNPVFQNAHQYGDILFTLGRAVATEVRTVAGRKALFQRIEFACDINPMAKIAYGLYKGKFLNAVSVGFVPLRWEDGSEEKGYQRKYLEQELLEVSAVGIPANPNALALGLKSGAIQKSDLHDLSDLIHLTLDQSTCSPSVALLAKEGPTRPSSSLLQMAKQLHSLLRS
jgi:Phage head maturation protease